MEVPAPYRFVRALGSGGMGQVCEVVHPDSGGRFALKTLHSSGAGAEELLRLRREAQAVAALNHPHVLRIHAAVLDGPAPYLVTELLEGGSLADRLGRIAPQEARRIAVELAEGLVHAHARGVLHRDLKPENVLFDGEGRAKLVDFGLARLRDDQRLTATGELLGSPGYMAPEQVVDAAQADARTDVYGLGAVLYAMLTGGPPVRARGGPLQVLEAVREQVPTPPRGLNPAAPDDLAAVCLRALAKDPAARQQSAAELLVDLAPPAARPRGLAWVASAALALLVGAAALALRPPAPGPSLVPPGPEPAGPAAPVSRTPAEPAEPAGPSAPRTPATSLGAGPREELIGVFDAAGRPWVVAHQRALLRWPEQGELAERREMERQGELWLERLGEETLLSCERDAVVRRSADPLPPGVLALSRPTALAAWGPCVAVGGSENQVLLVRGSQLLGARELQPAGAVRGLRYTSRGERLWGCVMRARDTLKDQAGSVFLVEDPGGQPGEARWFTPAGDPSAIDVHPVDPDRILVGTNLALVEEYRLQDGRLATLRRLPQPGLSFSRGTGRVHDVRYSRDGRLALAILGDLTPGSAVRRRELLVWSLEQDEVAAPRREELEEEPLSLAVTDQLVLVCGRGFARTFRLDDLRPDRR